MHILLDRHCNSCFIHFKLIILLLSQNSVTSSLQDFPFIRILCQQTAQDTLLTKPRSPSERCVCSRQFSVDLRLPSVQSQGPLGRSRFKNHKIQDFTHGKNIGRRAHLDQEETSEKYVQATFFGDQDASNTDHEWKREEPSGGA
jgi:hypothetical protein